MLTSSSKTAGAEQLFWVGASALAGAVILAAFPLYLVNETSVSLYALSSPILLTSACVAVLLSANGIRYSLASPLVIVASIYLVCLGLPSVIFALTPAGKRDPFVGLEYVSVVDLYALAVVLLFFLGFTLAELRNRHSQGRKAVGSYTKSPEGRDIHTDAEFAATKNSQYKTTANLLCVIAFSALACFYFSMRSQGMLNDDVLRGTGQFDSWNWVEYLALLGKGGLLMSTLTAGVLWPRHPYRRLWLVPFASFFMGATTDSRAVLLPFLLFLIPSTLVRRAVFGRRLIAVAVLCVLSAAYLLEVRPSHMGLGGFFKAVGRGPDRDEGVGLLAGVSSLEYTSGPFWVSNQAKPPHVIAQVWRLVNPLPSFVVEQNLFLTNMMPYLGVYGGNSGAPFPLLGELFFFFGWWGVGFAFPSGFLMSVVFRRCEKSLKTGPQENLLWPLLYMGFVEGMVDGMHSGLRTVTRFPVWAILWSIVFAQSVKLINGKKRPSVFSSRADCSP